MRVRMRADEDDEADHRRKRARIDIAEKGADEHEHEEDDDDDGEWTPVDESESVDSLEFDERAVGADDWWPKSWILSGMAELLLHRLVQYWNEAARAFDVRIGSVVATLQSRM
jgi:hypothetical protein